MMKIPFIRRIIAFVLALLLLFNSVNSFRVQAAFDDLGAGARAPGMANSFVGVADDVNDIHYNPAGLIQLKEGEVTTLYGRFLTGLNDGSNISTTYLGYGQPLRGGEWGAFGIGLKNFKADNLLNERTIYLSYGWKLKYQPFELPGVWSLGVTLKQLNRSFEPDRFAENSLNDPGTATGEPDPLFKNKGLSNTKYAFDLGTFYKFGYQNRYSAGLAIMNVNRPDVSLGGDNDKPPLITKFGLGYRPRWGVLSVEFRRANRLSSQTDSEVAFGAERRFTIKDIGAFEIRGGYAEGSRDFKALTAGLSYIFSKAELDYAFNMPIGNLSDEGGSHHVGFSFKFGAAKPKEEKEIAPKQDLIASFASDCEAATLAFKRAAESLSLTDYQRFLFLQMLIRKYALEDGAADKLREDLARLVAQKGYQLMDWPAIKASLLVTVKSTDISDVEDSLAKFAEGDSALALARLSLASPETWNNKLVQTFVIIGRAELAAQSYRKNAIDSCLDQVRQILEIIPQDEVVLDAYTRLLLMRAQETAPAMKVPEVKPAELPEAPATLVAPKPVRAHEEKVIHLSDFDKTVRGFGTALGYYFTRKSEGAPLEERLKLLGQIKTQYSGKGIDLSLVDKELEEARKESPKQIHRPKAKLFIAPKVKPAPAKHKGTKPALKKPAAAKEISPELERQWNYYQEALRRGITDRERIEILESIILKFGEAGTEKVKKEIEKVRKRSEQ